MQEFIEYMRTEKRKAENTLIAYERDLVAFEKFLKSRGAKGLNDCDGSDAVAYVMELSNENKSKATINRKVSALRTYYDYAIGKGLVSENPFSRIKAVKGDRRQIDYLTIEEAGKLMELPFDDRKGTRDKALLEFMYGTGARVTEVVRLRFEDLNLRMNFVTLRDSNDESRIVPLGKYAAAALNDYIDNVYDSLKGSGHSAEDHVFVNFRGEPLTIGIGSRMTPQILRDSFAVHILQNGGDLKTLQELMGFEDMSVGIAYLAVTDIHVREVFSACHPRAC